MLLAAVVVAPAAAQAPFPELIKNGDFAAWDTNPGEWDLFTGAQYGEGAVSTVAPADGGGLTLSGDAETALWRSAGQAFPAAPETLYRLEFDARVTGRTLAPRQFKNCYVGLLFFGAGKQRLAMKAFDVRSAPWRAGRLTALSPPGTARGSVFVVLTQTGTLSVRHVSLRQAANDPLGNFDLLASEMDQRYSYFAHKQVDWRALAESHRARARAGIGGPKSYAAIRRLLQELNDPHVVIIPEPDAPPVVTATPNTDRNFDLAPLLARVHKQQRTGMQMITGQLKEGFGYALVGSLQPQRTSAEAMATAFEALFDKPGIILDLRANGGGDEQVAQTILRGLVQARTVYAQSRSRSGPAEDDFTPAQRRVLHPSRDPAVPRYTKPVVALIGPVCMSSGEAMALMCKALPNVTVIGLPTRGASGNPKPIQLANGAQVLASTWVAMDADGHVFEGTGVQPDEVVAHGPDDPTLDRAIAILQAKTAAASGD